MNTKKQKRRIYRMLAELPIMIFLCTVIALGKREESFAEMQRENTGTQTLTEESTAEEEALRENGNGKNFEKNTDEDCVRSDTDNYSTKVELSDDSETVKIRGEEPAPPETNPGTSVRVEKRDGYTVTLEDGKVTEICYEE